MENSTIQDGKTTAIISYLTWVGTLIAFLMNNDKKNSFASFHIRQTIGLTIMGLANTFVISRFVDSWVTNILHVAIIVLWIIGLVAAANGEKKEVPLVGELFQDWFKGIA